MKQDRFSVPQEILTLLKLPNWHMELMLHLMNPDAEFPPHNPELHQVVRTLTEEVGVDRLMWGRTCRRASERSAISNRC